jgi:ABC-2 type transport system permease protein
VTIAVVRKELAVLLASPQPYVVGALFNLVLGLLVVNQLEGRDQALLQPLFPVAGFLLVVTVPVLAMRVLAEEARSGTLDVLLAVPVPIRPQVVGKWLAVWLTSLVVVAPSALFVVLVSWWGDPDFGPVIGGYVGLALLSAALAGVGVLASSLTTSQGLAAVGALLLALLLWFSATPDESGGAGGLLVRLSISERLRGFAGGVLDTADVAYFVVLLLGSVALAIVAVGGRRLR